MASTCETEAAGTFIPATQRPDGTWRKARRVKEGYVPQEEVPLYESKGKQWAKGRSDYPIGLHFEEISTTTQSVKAATIPGLSLSDTNSTKKSKKKKKKAKPENETSELKNVIDSVQKLSVNSSQENNINTNAQSDPAKKLKNLRKKLREIEMLESKIELGELPNPEKDQLEKISRKDEILEQIEGLELELDE